jgi:hypothetical protein
MSRGIVAAFETWKAGIPYPCMTGDIASTAELTVHEPDDGIVHFARWRPFNQDAISRSAVSAPASEEDGAGTPSFLPLGGDTIAHSRRGAIWPRLRNEAHNPE